MSSSSHSRGVVCRRGGVLQRATVFQIGRDPGRAEGVIAVIAPSVRFRVFAILFAGTFFLASAFSSRT